MVKKLYPHLFISLSFVTSAGLIRLAVDETSSPPPEPTFVSATEIFDNNDWEIQLTTSDGQSMTTDNEVDDRAPQIGGSLAVWQRITEKGWEIMSWQVNQEEKTVTSNLVDDTEPATDGQFIVWQQLTDSGWQILRLDNSHPNGQPEQLSEQSVNSMHPKASSDRVTWQAWIDDNWEIFSYDAVNGRSRLTTNSLPDLQPDISQNYLVWEGVDPQQGDRDIFAIDLVSNTEVIMTDNNSNDSGAMVDEDGIVEWYAETTTDATSLASTNAANEFTFQQDQGTLIQVTPEEPTPEITSTDTPSADLPPTEEMPADETPAVDDDSATETSTDSAAESEPSIDSSGETFSDSGGDASSTTGSDSSGGDSGGGGDGGAL